MQTSSEPVLCVGGPAHGTWVADYGRDYLHPTTAGTHHYRKLWMFTQSHDVVDVHERGMFAHQSLDDRDARRALEDFLIGAWVRRETVEPGARPSAG